MGLTKMFAVKFVEIWHIRSTFTYTEAGGGGWYSDQLMRVVVVVRKIERMWIMTYIYDLTHRMEYMSHVDEWMCFRRCSFHFNSHCRTRPHSCVVKRTPFVIRNGWKLHYSPYFTCVCACCSCFTTQHRSHSGATFSFHPPAPPPSPPPAFRLNYLSVCCNQLGLSEWECERRTGWRCVLWTERFNPSTTCLPEAIEVDVWASSMV